MAYKPPTKQSGSFGGMKGKAKIAFNPDHSKVQITFYKEENGEEVDIKTVRLTTFPEYLKSGRWYVRLNSEEKEILSANPLNGMFTVRVNKFVAAEGEEPTPKTRESSFNGKPYTFQEFYVVLDVTSPSKYKGVSLFVSLRYPFDEFTAEVDGKDVSIVGFTHTKAIATKLTMEFCDAAGVWDKGPMPYKPNILPLMAKRVAHANKEFQVRYENGWPNAFFEIQNDEEDEEDEKSTEFAPDVEDAPF